MLLPKVSDKSTPKNSPKLLDHVREKLRLKHYRIRTKYKYVGWIKGNIFYHGKQHPRDLVASDIEAFLTHLAVAEKVSACTQNLAKFPLLFLYRGVQVVLPLMKDTHALITSLLYSCEMCRNCSGIRMFPTR